MLQDIKNGGTPLHWAKEKEVVEALAESGCRLEAVDFNGDTALHVMARHERVDCVIGLICMGAKIDARSVILFLTAASASRPTSYLWSLPPSYCSKNHLMLMPSENR